MKASSALAQLRQLCCLGLPQEAFMPEFLRALSDAVPSAQSAAVFLDAKGAVDRIFTEQPLLLQAGREFAAHHANTDDERAAWANGSLAQFVHTGTIENAWHVDSAMTRSRYFGAVCAPFGIRHQMRARFSTDSGGGALFLARGAADGRFARHDEATLAAALPYLSHAAGHAPSAPRGDLVPLGEHGLMLLDARGAIQHMDRQATLLLCQAADGKAEPPQAILHRLRQIAQNLRSVAQGQDAPAPQARLQGRAGRFVLRGRWLNARSRENADVVAVSIERWVPLNLKITEALRGLPLSVRQKQLCLGLAQGQSFERVARELGIRPNTAVDYARIVYEKLDVHSREELKEKLLRPPVEIPHRKG